MKYISGDMVLDTSVLIEMIIPSDIGREILNEILSNRLKPHISEINLIELLYVGCRIFGKRGAIERINKLLRSGYFTIHYTSEIREYLADCKCIFPISLGDCSAISLGKIYEYPVLFLKLEKEFVKIINKLKDWANIQIEFIIY